MSVIGRLTNLLTEPEPDDTTTTDDGQRGPWESPTIVYAGSTRTYHRTRFCAPDDAVAVPIEEASEEKWACRLCVNNYQRNQ